MVQTAILFPRPAKPASTIQIWLSRAAQARRVASMLSAKDAEVIEAYALECEAEARRLIGRPAPAIAA
jgi:hypothetical protein